MVKPKILVVDDDPATRDLLRSLLADRFLIDEAEDGLSCLCRLGEDQPHLVLLDTEMPRLEGWQTLQRIRTHSRLPIIMLVSGDDVKERVRALRLGADDSLAKPLDPLNVAVRVAAVLRQRGFRRLPRAVLRKGALLVDPAHRAVQSHSGKVHLTPLEFDLFRVLTAHPGQALSRDDLFDRVWGPEADGEPRLIDRHIMNLRRKLGDRDGLVISSVRGTGYRFCPPESPVQ